MKFWTKFVFHLGLIHTNFVMHKVLGKFIEQSGLDRIFVESEL